MDTKFYYVFIKRTNNKWNWKEEKVDLWRFLKENYSKELKVFLLDKGSSLDSETKDRINKNPFRFLDSKNPQHQELIELAEERDMGVLTLGDLNDAEYDFVKKEWYPEEEDAKEKEPEEEKPDEP